MGGGWAWACCASGCSAENKECALMVSLMRGVRLRGFWGCGTDLEKEVPKSAPFAPLKSHPPCWKLPRWGTCLYGCGALLVGRLSFEGTSVLLALGTRIN